MLQLGLVLVVRLAGAGVGFLMTVIVARVLPPHQSGLFFLGFTIFSVLGALSTLGLTTAFIRFIGAYSSEGNWGVVNGGFSRGVKLIFIASTVSACFLIIFSSLISINGFNKPELEWVLVLFSLAIPGFSIALAIGFVFQGLSRPLVAVFLQNISTQGLMVVILSSMFFYGFSLDVFMVTKVYVGLTFVTLFLSFVFWFVRAQSREISDFSEIPELINSAKLLWPAMFMTILVQFSGQIISGVFVTEEDLAYFSVAQRTAMLISFVLIAVNLVVAPKFAASAKRNNISELRTSSLFCSRVMVVLAIPVLAIMFFFPEVILSLFGKEYMGASHLLQILAVGQFVNVATGSVGFLLNMSGHEKDMRNVVFLSGPVAVILCVVLIPLYGVTGAAIATAVALASQNLLAVYKVKQRLGFNTLRLL